MSTVTFNYDHSDILNEKLVSLYTSSAVDGKINLHGVFELTINHPEAKGLATLKVLESRIIKSGNRVELPEAVLLEAAQSNITKHYSF